MVRRRRKEPNGFGKQDSGSWIEVSGKVVRLLSDDDEGSRHQRFIIRLRSERTLLVAHNIDLVARVPVGLGDRVDVNGMYEWNELGGLVHWTHHDPMGHEPGGYVRHAGTVYR